MKKNDFAKMKKICGFNVPLITHFAVGGTLLLTSCGEKSSENRQAQDGRGDSEEVKVVENKVTNAQGESLKQLNDILDSIYKGKESNDSYVIDASFNKYGMTLKKCRDLYANYTVQYKPQIVRIEKGYLDEIHFKVEVEYLKDGSPPIKYTAQNCIAVIEGGLDSLEGNFFPIQDQIESAQSILISRNTSLPTSSDKSKILLSLNSATPKEFAISEIRNKFVLGDGVFDSKVHELNGVDFLNDGRTKISITSGFCEYSKHEKSARIASKEVCEFEFDKGGKVSSLNVIRAKNDYVDIELLSPRDLRLTKYRKFISQFQEESGSLFVRSIYPKSQAYYMGLRKGDRITAIDNENVDLVSTPLHFWLEKIQVSKSMTVVRGFKTLNFDCDNREKSVHQYKSYKEVKVNSDWVLHSPKKFLEFIVSSINASDVDSVIYLTGEFQKSQEFHLRFSGDIERKLNKAFEEARDYNLSSSGLVAAACINEVEARVLNQRVITGKGVFPDHKTLIAAIELKYKSPDLCYSVNGKNFYKAVFEVHIEIPQGRRTNALTKVKLSTESSMLFPDSSGDNLPDEGMIVKVIRENINTSLVCVREGDFKFNHEFKIADPTYVSFKGKPVGISTRMCVLGGDFIKNPDEYSKSDFFDALGINFPLDKNSFVHGLTSEVVYTRMWRQGNAPCATKLYDASAKFSGRVDLPPRFEGLELGYEEVKNICKGKLNSNLNYLKSSNRHRCFNLVKSVELHDVSVYRDGGKVYCDFTPHYEYSIDKSDLKLLEELAKASAITGYKGYVGRDLVDSVVSFPVNGTVLK